MKKFIFKNPKIKCQTCKLFFECIYLYAIAHKIHELLLIEIYEFDKFDEKEFNNFF